MTDSSNHPHSEASKAYPALSAEQAGIVALIHRDRESLDPGPQLSEAIATESVGLMQPHPAITAMTREAASLDPADLSSRVFSATVDLLPQPRTTPLRMVEVHQPVRRARFTRRAALLLAASLAVAFVVGGVLLKNGVPQGAPHDIVFVDPPEDDFVPDMAPIFIPISAGDDDLDDAINDATSLIAFSDLTLEDIEFDLAAIERVLQQ